MIGLIEHKDFVGQIKDVDRKSRVITGYLSAFDDQKDHDGDIAEFGMFTKTIAERGPKGKNEIFFLNQHIWAQPHGKFAVLEEQEGKGLYFESEKLPNTTYSNDAIELYAEGIVKEHSYGFVRVNQVFDKERNAVRIKEVKLYEGSNVTLGSDSNTPFTGFKNKSLKEINDRCSTITKMLRNGTLTDDMFLQLEIALKQLQRESFELGKSLKEPSIEDTRLRADDNNEVEILNEYLKRWN
jgi:HK97 family phage prohead protease